MKATSKQIGLAVGALVLVGALALQFMRIRDVHRGDMTSPPVPIGLATRVPQQVDGWTATDTPLGATENVESKVEQMLNYDDYVYRVYGKGGVQFSVYAAYWSPGRMPMERVASHTPDRCWSENGWTCTRFRYPETLTSTAGALKPGYWRIFVPPNGGAQQYVMYWHLVGDELYDYGGGFNRRLGIVKWWRDMVHYAFAGSREQYFIRLTSDRPFENLRGDPGFEQVLDALARLGLAAR